MKSKVKKSALGQVICFITTLILILCEEVFPTERFLVDPLIVIEVLAEE